MWVANYAHFFNKNMSIYAIFNDQSFSYILTNDIVRFEQLGPDFYKLHQNVHGLSRAFILERPSIICAFPF